MPGCADNHSGPRGKKEITTLSPGRTRAHPGPTASTVPAPSEQGTTGRVWRGFGAPKGLRYTRMGSFFDRNPGALEGIPFCLGVTSAEYRALWPRDVNLGLPNWRFFTIPTRIIQFRSNWCPMRPIGSTKAVSCAADIVAGSVGQYFTSRDELGEQNAQVKEGAEKILVWLGHDGLALKKLCIQLLSRRRWHDPVRRCRIPREANARHGHLPAYPPVPVASRDHFGGCRALRLTALTIRGHFAGVKIEMLTIGQ